jgi:hypothetical protein
MPGTVIPQSATGPPRAPNGAHPNRDEQVGLCICASPIVILVAVLIYAAADHLGPEANFGSVVALGIAAGAAALISGVFVGFLFGLPQTLKQDNPTGLLTTNTSLDQITDWLTKILVGLGLVQLGRISHGVSRLSTSLAPGLGGGPGAKAFATAMLIYGAADGFLIGYLWARIILSKRFNAAARGLAKENVQEIDAALKPKPPTPPLLGPKPKVEAQSVANEAQIRGLGPGTAKPDDPEADEAPPADPV